MIKSSVYGLFMVACSFIASCTDNASVHETVLRPGERIIATNRFGKVTITYVSPDKRLYEGGGFHEIRRLQPRTERWYGCLGLYDPADTFSRPLKVRLVLQEGIRNFRDEKQLAAELRESSASEDWVYDDSGLVVGFGRVPERGNQINVDVFQYLIDGKKPSDIPGARPAQVHRESFDPFLTKKYNAELGVKPQDEIPPLINDPFNSYGAVGQELKAGH